MTLNITSVAESKAWLEAWEAERDLPSSQQHGESMFRKLFPLMDRANIQLSERLERRQRRSRRPVAKKRSSARRGRR